MPPVSEQLADAINAHYRVLVYTLAFGGPRWGEAAALRRGRIELRRSRLHVVETAIEARGQLAYVPPKNGRPRKVALPAFLCAMLAEHLEAAVAPGRDALVFTTPGGRPLRYSNFRSRVWYPALEAAKLPRVGVHALRHTPASLLIDAGAHPKSIQRHLGHSSITTTLNIYGHLVPDEQDQVADALDDLRAGQRVQPWVQDSAGAGRVKRR